MKHLLFFLQWKIVPALPRIPNLTMSLERRRRRGWGPFCFGPGFPIFGKELILFFKKRLHFRLLLSAAAHILFKWETTHTHPAPPFKKPVSSLTRKRKNSPHYSIWIPKNSRERRPSPYSLLLLLLLLLLLRPLAGGHLKTDSDLEKK